MPSKKRNKDEMLRRIAAIRAKAASTPFPNEADALLRKADELKEKLGTDVSRPAAKPSDANGVALGVTGVPGLSLPDAVLLGVAASACGVRAVRIDLRLTSRTGRHHAPIELFGRTADITGALALKDLLVEHREEGLRANRQGVPLTQRTAEHDRQFRLAYGAAIRGQLRRRPARNTVVARSAEQALTDFVYSHVRVHAHGSTPSGLQPASADTRASAAEWASKYPGPATPGLLQTRTNVRSV